MDDEISLIYNFRKTLGRNQTKKRDEASVAVHHQVWYGTNLVCLSRILDHYAEMVHETLQGISLDLMLAVGAYGNVQKKI